MFSQFLYACNHTRHFYKAWDFSQKSMDPIETF